jgi:hypothetical protein
MGWWSEKRGKKKIELGDEPIDLLHEMVRVFCESYQEGTERNPTSEEFLTSLQMAIGTAPEDYFEDLAGKEITGVALKTKAVPKRQKYQPGDYFAVPLSETYAYGRVVYDDVLTVVEFYNVRSTEILNHRQLISRKPKPKVVFTKNIFPQEALLRRRWIVIGHEPIPKNYKYPRFYMGAAGFFTITEGPKKRKRATPKQASKYEPTLATQIEQIEANLEAEDYDNWPVMKRYKTEHFG